MPQNRRFATRGIDQSGEQFERGRFPSTIRSQKGDHLALFNLKAYLLDSLDGFVLTIE